MALEITDHDGVMILAVPHRFDADNAPGIESELKNLLAGGPRRIVLDFSGTAYIASAGLRVILVITRDQMKAGGKVALAGIRPPVLRVFEMAGFTSIFTIRTSREEAVKAVL